jgi:hypothetical protein
MLTRRISFVMLVLFVFVLLLAVVPAFAQEVTATAAPPVVVTPAPGEVGAITAASFVPWLVLIILVLVVGFVVLAHTSIAKAAALVPPAIVETAIAAGDRALQFVKDYTTSTAEPLDDAAVNELQKQYDALKEEYRQLALQRNTPVPPVTGLDGAP